MGDVTKFWERPIETLDKRQWEALCDGCGQCCLHKVEDADTGEIYHTNVACKLLDLKTARCSSYADRRSHVPDCTRLTVRNTGSLDWLPDTCAYRLREAGEALPEWHYLVCGDREAVHRAGMSIVGRAVSETVAGPLEQHIIWPAGMEAMEIESEDDPWAVSKDGTDHEAGDIPQGKR